MLAGIPQTPKSFPWDLRGSRKHQKVFRGTCGAPANTKKFLGRLAGLPQTPKSFSRDLRDSRKHFEEVSGLCSVSAKVLFPILVFAGLLQGRISLFWRLQNSCKRPFLHFDVCRSPASLLVWRKPKEGSGKNDRVLGDKCIGSNGFASAKKRQSVGIDEDGA